MDAVQLREYCLSFPGVTEDIKWGADLCFCVGKKMFAVTGVDSSSPGLSIKCSPDDFADLIEREGIAPAAYVGRYGWVHLDRLDAVSTTELKALIKDSYKLVFEKLPRAVRIAIAS